MLLDSDLVLLKSHARFTSTELFEKVEINSESITESWA